MSRGFNAVATRMLAYRNHQTLFDEAESRSSPFGFPPQKPRLGGSPLFHQRTQSIGHRVPTPAQGRYRIRFICLLLT